jgi:hypothetical protein
MEMGLGNESCRGLFRRAAGVVKFTREGAELSALNARLPVI